MTSSASGAMQVAFFRNLNLGRPRCPTRDQFEAAFMAAGASQAASFLTNGTIVFTAGPRRRPAKVLRDACQAMQVSCGLVEPAFLRSLDRIVELVASDPFKGIDPADVYECCVSFLHEDVDLAALPATPLWSTRRDVLVLNFAGADACSISLKIGNTPGSPNALLEKRLGLPATTRSFSTLRRLVGKYAAR